MSGKELPCICEYICLQVRQISNKKTASKEENVFQPSAVSLAGHNIEVGQ